MKISVSIAIAVNCCALPALAQQRPAPADVKMLTPAECALIDKRSENEFYIRGPVIIGGVKIWDQEIKRRGISVNGVDNFDVVQRSCFMGKST